MTCLPWLSRDTVQAVLHAPPPRHLRQAAGEFGQGDSTDRHTCPTPKSAETYLDGRCIFVSPHGITRVFGFVTSSSRFERVTATNALRRSSSRLRPFAR